MIGDFNMEEESHHLSEVIQTFALSCHITKPISQKSKIAPCIDLIQIKKNLFKLFDNFETGFSDHHILRSTIMKSGNFKGPRKKMSRSNKIFNLGVFYNTLNMEFHRTGNSNSYTLFKEKLLFFLNKKAPLKTKLPQCNSNAFMSMELRKSIMLRSKLKNNFNENRSYEN